MKILKILKTTILPLGVAAALMLPTTSNIVYAKETTQQMTLDESFIPSRCYIPFYLSQYSSFKSPLIKSLWEKVFYEERNWNSSKESGSANWVTKYNDNYIGLGGVTKKLSSGVQNGKITYSSGDFEAFFSNSLLANPEFLGELMGLTTSGYKKISDNTTGNNQMQEVICNYLSNPGKYEKYFVPAMVKLTADGTYIGTSKTSANNRLKKTKHASTGITMDYYMLNTLASLYRQKDGNGNTILSSIQNKWLESYQLYLYDDYVKSGSNSLAAKYPSIKDLIARSSYAANNRGGKGQEFFNYVVDSGEGAGAWLNLNDKIDIRGLNDVANLETLFTMSNGWCGGIEPTANCTHSSKCLSRATLTDILATYLHKNSTAVTYITNNSKLKSVYGTSDTNGWRYKYKLKHSPGTGAETYDVGINCATFTPTKGNENTSTVACDVGTSDSWGWCMAGSSAEGYVTVPLNKIPTNAQHLEISFNFTSNSIPDHDSERILKDYTLTVNGGNIASKAPKTERWSSTNSSTRIAKIDLHKLSLSERQNGVIKIYAYVTSFADANGMDGNHVTARAIAKVTALQNVVANCKRPRCDIEGHSWSGNPDWEHSDFKTVKINYTCGDDAAHSTSENAVVTAKQDGNYIVYSAVSSGMIDSSTGKLLSYTKRVAKGYSNTASGAQTISLNKNNISGSNTSEARSGEWVFPAGSISKETYKQVATTLKFSVSSGVVKTGAKSVTANVTASDKLDDLSIMVMSATGKCIAQSDYAINKNTAYIYGASDDELNGCYVIITAKASTINRTYNYSRQEPSDAIAKLAVNSITVNY